ncbi:MAG: competence protein ComEA-like protein with helix-hairpin-helix repeat region [Paenibacillus sp.]|uniref:ComEA family DNA-binding protein n=1 Tax=Paenibacillus sp. GCM10012303 TaxID=3317340 RepID=UPI0029E8D4A4|nr:competence protein ComEA-like protein with helix-hairpin-helix repeat region [Paenibacillus sp.]
MNKRATNRNQSFYAVAVVWSILALLLWTADTVAQGRGMHGAGWTVRGAELLALFAAVDGERQPAGTAPEPGGGKAQAGGSGSAAGHAGQGPVAGPAAPGGAVSGGGTEPAPPPVPVSPPPEGAIDINRASAAELQQLPGIGPSKAKAIIDYRTAGGGFKSPEELMKVKGIGEKTFEQLKPRIHIGN